jgi:hypothetical protein
MPLRRGFLKTSASLPKLEVFKTQSPFLIAGILKEFVVGGLRPIRALRRETAVKRQGLSCVIG